MRPIKVKKLKLHYKYYIKGGKTLIKKKKDIQSKYKSPNDKE